MGHRQRCVLSQLLRPTLRRRARGGEAGIVLTLFALLLVVFLIFVAFAVDLGSVYNLRRQDQSAADVGSLAAAQELPNKSNAVIEAKSYVHDTLKVTFTDAQWNSCTTDTGALSVRATGANCISFDGDSRRIRVRIPDQQYNTAFARVAGISTMKHSAFAIAGLQVAGFGGVLPFGITFTNGGSGHTCLKTGPNGAATPVCTGPFGPGNFGTLSFAVHGPERAQDCSPTQDSVTINNIAIGVDHELSLRYGTPHGSTVVSEDGPPACADLANAAEGDTGNTANKLGAALYSGGGMDDGLGPRLRRGDYGQRTTIAGKTNVDDNPLWSFIPPSLNSSIEDVPTSCQRNQFVNVGGVIDPTFPFVSNANGARTHILNLPGSGQTKLQNQMIKLLERCFAHYEGDDWNDFGALVPAEPPVDPCTGPCSDPVFSLNSSTSDSPDLFDIQYTPRFAYVPEMEATTFCSGSNCTNPWVDFRAVYMQRMCIGNNSCDFEYDPGFGMTGGSDTRANSLTAWLFPKTMLPNGLGESDAPFAIGKSRFVRLVR
jgi:Flp pilus assembly protein TadG